MLVANDRALHELPEDYVACPGASLESLQDATHGYPLLARLRRLGEEGASAERPPTMVATPVLDEEGVRAGLLVTLLAEPPSDGTEDAQPGSPAQVIPALRESLDLLQEPLRASLADSRLRTVERERARLALGSAGRLVQLLDAWSDVPSQVPPASREPHRLTERVGSADRQREAPRILVVDRDPDVRAYLVALLNRRWRVAQAATGTEAMARVRRRPPDIVLAELAVPEGEGLDLLRALRARPETATIPVLLLSGRIGLHQLGEALESGSDDLLVKPFSSRELVARVEARLALAHARRRQQAQREAALEISQAALADHETADVLLSVVRQARRLVAADGATIALPTAEGPLRVAAADGATGPRVAGVALDARHSPEALVLRTGRLRVLAGPPRAAAWGEELGPLVVAPLRTQRRRLGVLEVHRRAGGDRFDRPELDVLRMLANEAALALEQGGARRARQRLAAMEAERTRIAREIHDDTLQSLAATSLHLELIRGRLGQDPRREHIDGLLWALRESAGHLRGLVTSLRSDAIEQGLTSALRSYATEGPIALSVPCYFESHLRAQPGLETARSVYRVAQEALDNVREHAGATEVRILLEEKAGGVHARIVDDGRGFDPAAILRSTWPERGLRRMKERAELAHGRLEVESTPGHGTSIDLWVPDLDEGGR